MAVTAATARALARAAGKHFELTAKLRVVRVEAANLLLKKKRKNNDCRESKFYVTERFTHYNFPKLIFEEINVVQNGG
jgi:hypothetical protein